MEQNNYISRKFCPSCGSENTSFFLEVADYRVSSDHFPIHSCGACGLHFTALVPTKEDISAFYKSDTYDSHRLDNKSLISRLYRFVRRLNTRFKVSWVKKYHSGGLVVDYGCGLGHFVRALQNEGFDSKGYEIDPEVRSLSSIELGIHIEPLESYFGLENCTVDVLTMWHVLEHIYDLNEDVSKVFEKLKQHGIALIAVPNFKSYDAQVYGSSWEAYDVPRHLYHFDRETIISFIEKFGLSHVATYPMRFDSFYVSMRSEKNLSSSNLLRAVWTGFYSNVKGNKHGYSSHVFVFRKR